MVLPLTKFRSGHMVKILVFFLFMNGNEREWCNAHVERLKLLPWRNFCLRKVVLIQNGAVFGKALN